MPSRQYALLESPVHTPYKTSTHVIHTIVIPAFEDIGRVEGVYENE